MTLTEMVGGAVTTWRVTFATQLEVSPQSTSFAVSVTSVVPGPSNVPAAGCQLNRHGVLAGRATHSVLFRPVVPNEFLARRGLYLRPDFLSANACASLTQLMLSCRGEPAQIYKGGNSEATIDEHARRALSVDVGSETARTVELALDGLREDLSRHFQRSLTDREPSNYLVYGPGSFFAPHRDRATKARAALDEGQREVAACHLRQSSAVVGTTGYLGGELRFYGLLDGSEWGDVGSAAMPRRGSSSRFPRTRCTRSRR